KHQNEASDRPFHGSLRSGGGSSARIQSQASRCVTGDKARSRQDLAPLPGEPLMGPKVVLDLDGSPADRPTAYGPYRAYQCCSAYPGGWIAAMIPGSTRSWKPAACRWAVKIWISPGPPVFTTSPRPA